MYKYFYPSLYDYTDFHAYQIINNNNNNTLPIYLYLTILTDVHNICIFNPLNK